MLAKHIVDQNTDYTYVLYYKEIEIVNDDSKVFSKWRESSLVSDAPNCGIMFTIVMDNNG